MIRIAAASSMPDINMLTNTISGVGINGEIDSPTIGQFKSIEHEIEFNVLYSSVVNLLSPLSAVGLTFRAAQQVYDKYDGYAFKGVHIVERSRVKSLSLGKIEKGETMGSKITLEVTYILVEVDSQLLVEIDKLNSVYKTNGNDMLAGVRELI